MSITAGDRTGCESSKKVATHSTLVWLYCGRATILRVFTRLLFSSFIVLGVMSGLLILRIDVPFISQLIESAV